MRVMLRSFLTAVLAVCVSCVPAIRAACDLACAAPAPAPPSGHCSNHAPESSAPAAPSDRCNHDHQSASFVAPAKTTPIDIHTHFVPTAAPARVTPRIAPASTRLARLAREGPPRPARYAALRI